MPDRQMPSSSRRCSYMVDSHVSVGVGDEVRADMVRVAAITVLAVEGEVARLLLRNAANTVLDKTEDGLFKPADSNEPEDFEGAEESVYVTTHGLEGSSVKSYDVLTRMIEIERGYEVKVNIIKELGAMSESAMSLMQVN